MQKFPSTEAKDKWGAISDAALQEPVSITRHGRPSLVLTSAQDYEELQKLRFEKLKADVEVGIAAAQSGEFSEKSIEDIKLEARRRSQQD